MAFTQMRANMILRAYVWVVSPPIMGNESLLTNTERAPGTRYAAYLRAACGRARYFATRLPGALSVTAAE